MTTKTELEPLEIARFIGDRFELEYLNHRGELSIRLVRPHKVWFGLSPHHGPVPQFFLSAYEPSRDVHREFAMKDILSIKAVP